MKLQISIWILLVFITCFNTDNQLVAEENPLTIIETASGKMIIQLEQNKHKIADDSTIVVGIVEDLLLPHFASNTIARKVLGKYAKKVTLEQKKQFSEAFRYHMLRFYSKIFSAYTNQTFEYLDAPNITRKKRVTVKTRLIQEGGRPIPIDYRMQRSGDSWKIIDLRIEGISMVTSNRSQFGSQIYREGIDAVIAKLDHIQQQN